LAHASKSHTSSDDDGDVGPVQSTKMKALLRFLREDMAAQRRVVVFSQWTSFLDLIGPVLDSATIPFRRFDGSLSREERQACVSWLSEGIDVDRMNMRQGRVLLISLKAGGVGLNLTVASRLYLLDLWWNPAVEEQAIQRVHRIGQKSEVHVYKFVVSNSIDTDLLSLQGAKSRLLEDALESGGSGQTASKLSMDDIKRLFNPCQTSLKNLQGSVEVQQVPSDSLACVEPMVVAEAVPARAKEGLSSPVDMMAQEGSSGACDATIEADAKCKVVEAKHNHTISTSAQGRSMDSGIEVEQTLDAMILAGVKACEQEKVVCAAHGDDVPCMPPAC